MLNKLILGLALRFALATNFVFCAWGGFVRSVPICNFKNIVQFALRGIIQSIIGTYKSMLYCLQYTVHHSAGTITTRILL
jgi:hypothetical protein